MAVIDLKNAIIQVRGGTQPDNKITVVLGEGNLTYDEKRNMDYVRDRGLLDTVKEGDEEPMDVRLDATWEFITGTGSEITIEDAMKQRGNASDWTSTSADACEPYAVDIYILYSPPCGGDQGETIVLPDFRWESISHDLRAGTLSFTGKCNNTQATVSRGGVST